MTDNSRIRGLVALSPLAVFLCLYLLTSLIVGDFYKVPITVAFLVSAAYSVAISAGMPLRDRITQFSRGASDSNILLMVWIFIMAGAFARAAADMGCIRATVGLSLAILPENLIPAGLFLGSCFISISVGTSVGTIVALVPVAVGICEATGADMAFFSAIVVGGAFFGDNLSFISDTTIAATRTQGCAMLDKFRTNLRIVLPAAAVIFVLYLFYGLEDVPAEVIDSDIDYVKIIPYMVVLGTAIAGMNVVLVLALGLLATGVIGLATGSCGGVFGWFGSMGAGISDMGSLIIVTLLAGGMLEMIRYNGGIDYILRALTRRIRGRRGAELSIAALVSLANVCTANNTIAIITVGPIAADIAKRYGVDPRKSASILDTFSCVVQGVIPYGAQLLMASSLAAVSPLSIIRYLYYPMAVLIFALLGIAIKNSKTRTTGVAAVAAVCLLCGACTRTVPVEHSLQACVPAKTAATMHCDLDAWLKGCGCRSNDGAIVVDANLAQKIAHVDADLADVLSAMAACGAHADLRDVYLVKCEHSAPWLGVTRLRPEGSMPEGLHSEGDVLLTVSGGNLWFAKADAEGMEAALHQAMEAAAGASIATEEALLSFFGDSSGNKSASLTGVISLPDFKNPLGEDFSRVMFECSFTDTSLSSVITCADSKLRPKAPFSALTDIDSEFYEMLPANAAVTLAIGLGDDVKMSEIVDLATSVIKAPASLALRFMYGALAPFSGQVTAGVAPGGNAETIRDLSPSHWLAKAVIPVSEERADDLSAIVDAATGGDVMVYGYGDYTILQNYDDAYYPDADTQPDIKGGTRFLLTAEVPYNSEVMKAFNLPAGFHATVAAGDSALTARLQLLGPGRLLRVMTNDK